MANEVSARNVESAERLRAIGERLSDDELLRVIDGPWTAAALFVHMAFWDRFAEARWRGAQAAGKTSPEPVDDAPLEWINTAAIPEWQAFPPREAVAQCLAAAESINRFLDAVDPVVINEVLGSERTRLVDRSLHRGDHLATIERTFLDPRRHQRVVGE
jgi:hypothetical protein